MQCFDTFRGFLHKLYAATMDGKGRQGIYNFFSWRLGLGQPGAGHMAQGQLPHPRHPAGATHAAVMNCIHTVVFVPPYIVVMCTCMGHGAQSSWLATIFSMKASDVDLPFYRLTFAQLRCRSTDLGHTKRRRRRHMAVTCRILVMRRCNRNFTAALPQTGNVYSPLFQGTY